MKTSPKHIALYGGTFDPIHLGHLIQAIDALYAFGLDTVIFIPCRLSPHKSTSPSAPDAIRWQMIKRAIAPYAPALQADKIELTRPAPSYTYDTVNHYRTQNPQARLYWILGQDQLPRLHTWHRYEELVTLLTWIVLPRSSPHTKLPNHSQAKYKKASIIPWPHPPRILEISSTEIRQRIRQNIPYSHLVPPSTYRIIQKHNLYAQTPFPSSSRETGTQACR